MYVPHKGVAKQIFSICESQPTEISISLQDTLNGCLERIYTCSDKLFVWGLVSFLRILLQYVFPGVERRTISFGHLDKFRSIVIGCNPLFPRLWYMCLAITVHFDSSNIIFISEHIFFRLMVRFEWGGIPHDSGSGSMPMSWTHNRDNSMNSHSICEWRSYKTSEISATCSTMTSFILTFYFILFG